MVTVLISIREGGGCEVEDRDRDDSVRVKARLGLESGLRSGVRVRIKVRVIPPLLQSTHTHHPHTQNRQHDRTFRICR